MPRILTAGAEPSVGICRLWSFACSSGMVLSLLPCMQVGQQKLVELSAAWLIFNMAGWSHSQFVVGEHLHGLFVEISLGRFLASESSTDRQLLD